MNPPSSVCCRPIKLSVLVPPKDRCQATWNGASARTRKGRPATRNRRVVLVFEFMGLHLYACRLVTHSFTFHLAAGFALVLLRTQSLLFRLFQLPVCLERK